jgi:hypothetical protein
MNEFSRIKRPTTERTEPQRAVGGARPDLPLPSNPEAPQSANSAETKDNAYRAVNDAYRLVDDYLREGQRMAENIWLPIAGQADGGQSTAPSLEAPGRFMRAMSDMTLAWVEVMQQWSAAAQPAPKHEAPTGHAGPFKADRERGNGAPGPAPSKEKEGRAGRRALSVSVESVGRVQVSVSFDDFHDATRLVAGAMTCFGASAPPIEQVSVGVGPDQLPELRIVVPPGQPAGTYHGLLANADTHHPCGSVSLRISPAEG